MSYTINLTNGTTLIPGGLSDGSVDNTSTSLVLIGKDYAGYGQFLNENFVYLLENFANSTGPANPLKGQLWWDTTNNILKVYSGSSWKISTGATSAPAGSPPGDLSALGGDLWFDTTNQQLKLYSGSSWVVIGPQAAGALQTTGTFAATILDTLGAAHKVIELQFNGVVYAIIAYEAFATSYPGFTTIRAGLNFSTTASPSWGLSTQDVNPTPNTLVQRNSTGAINADSIVATSDVTAQNITATSTIYGTFSGPLNGDVTATTVSSTTVTAGGISASEGFTGRLLTPSQPNITGIGTLTALSVAGITTLTGSATLNGNAIATVGGSTSFTSLDNTPIGSITPSTGIFTTLQVNTSLIPIANVVIDIGTSSLRWNNVYGKTFIGTSVAAQYADLAERFHADQDYPAGTVVEMGGVAEITKVVEDLSEQVFGVISTNAAYLMNSAAGTDVTHPPVAMSGRVPVRVIGMIAKGDRLVSAGNGLARAGKRSELTPFNVIGRALENKETAGESVIEAIVKLNS